MGRRDKAAVDSGEGAQEAARSSGEVNAELLDAVRMGDSEWARRALSRGAPEWLDGPECRSDDPEVNAALAAVLSPHGPGCAKEFDAYFGDVRSWRFGLWPASHWAVAARLPETLAWALGGPVGSRRSARRGERDEGLLEAEDAPKDAMRSHRRSALALAAQMGDPKWLAEVLAIAEECGADIGEMAKRDRFSKPTALGAALFEMASRAREGEGARKVADARECALVLAARGFPADSAPAAAAKLCAALALAHPRQGKANRAMAPAIRLAAALGSGAERGGAPIGAQEAAGRALDPRWGQALRLCGVDGPGDGVFALGAGARLLERLGEGRALGADEWRSLSDKGELRSEILASMESSGTEPSALAAALRARAAAGSEAPFEAAGRSLDARWARALLALGLSEPEDGCFAAGAGERMLAALRSSRSGAGADLPELPGEPGSLAAEVGRSLARSGRAPESLPMRGEEAGCALWMERLAAGADVLGAAAYKERVEMALASEPSARRGKPLRV